MNNNKWLSTKEALSFLKQQDVEISKTGLIFIGMRLHFYRKKRDGFYWEFNQQGLINYCKKRTPPDKDKYVLVSELVDEKKVYPLFIYRKIKEWAVEVIYCGGVMYANKKQFYSKYQEMYNGKRGKART